MEQCTRESLTKVGTKLHELISINLEFFLEKLEKPQSRRTRNTEKYKGSWGKQSVWLWSLGLGDHTHMYHTINPTFRKKKNTYFLNNKTAPKVPIFTESPNSFHPLFVNQSGETPKPNSLSESSYEPSVKSLVGKTYSAKKDHSLKLTMIIKQVINQKPVMFLLIILLIPLLLIFCLMILIILIYLWPYAKISILALNIPFNDLFHIMLFLLL